MLSKVDLDTMRLLLEQSQQIGPVISHKTPDTLAQVFRQENKENFLSDWLAYLLDPTKMLDYTPLNSFLSLLNNDKSDIVVIEEDEVVIEREFTFNNGRRIDILITTNEYVIGIENKIWSGENDGQLRSYYTSLKEMASVKKNEIRPGVYIEKTPILIFLKPQRNGTLPSEKQAVTIFYEDLVQVFKVIQMDFINHMRESFLMLDFVAYVEGYLMGNEFAAGDFTRFLQANAAQILDLKQNIDREIGDFRKYLDAQVSKLADSEDWETRSHTKSHFFQLYKKGWKDSQIHYEITTTDETGQLMEPYQRPYILPIAYRVVLHCEGKKNTQFLFNEIKQKADTKFTKNFVLCYDSAPDFERSVQEIIATLDEMKKEFTKAIDDFVFKIGNQ